MSQIKEFAILICASLLISGVLYAIRPVNGVNITLKTAINIFWISVCLFSMFNIKDLSYCSIGEIETEISYSEDFNVYIKNETMNRYCSQIEEQIGLILDARGVKEYRLETNSHISEQDEIIIDKVIIYSNYISQDTIEYIESKTNIDVETNEAY